MKTRKLLIIILVAALLIVYYFIGTDYLKERRQHTALASQVSDANQALALIAIPPTDLEQRLAEAQADLVALENSFAVDTNDTKIINTVLRLAEEIDVKAIPLSTQPWTIESVAGRDYSVFRIDMVVVGTFTQLQSFSDRLENGQPETLVIEHLNIERIPDSPGDKVQINASIKIAVYALPPATE